MEFKPLCSTQIMFASKLELMQIIDKLEYQNLCLVMSQSSAIRWDMVKFIEKLEIKRKNTNSSFVWVDKISPNPTQIDIFNAFRKIKNKRIDVLVAIGGGSVIDLAKCISAIYDTNEDNNYTKEDITEKIINKSYKEKKLSNSAKFVDIIAIPSTSGTGSEVTSWATIWDEDKKEKYSLDDPHLKPKLAIISPELTISMPREMTLSAGLDALSQAIESYWSKHQTPISQEMALRAIDLIIENLKLCLNDPNNLYYRDRLCRGSVMAGLAFSQTRTTACHSISYPLTMMYNIPHGLAAAITLDGVSNLNKGNFPNDNLLFKRFDKIGGIRNFISDVSEGIIDMRLSKFGIKKRDIPVIAKNAFTAGRMDNNPVDLNQDDVEKILHEVF